MSGSRAKSKPKSKKTVLSPRRTPEGTRAGNSVTPTSGSQLGAFYSAGPVFGLGAPVQTKVVVGRANDPFEREADAAANMVAAGRRVPSISRIPAGGLSSVAQRQEEEEPVQEMAVQRQEEEEEEPVQEMAVQRQEEEEEPVQETAVQRQEEEEPIQELAVQRQEEEEEEPVQETAVQRQEEEEEPVQETAVQRQEEEEEPVETSLVQRQKEQEEPVETMPIQHQEEEEPVQEMPVQRQAEEEEPVETMPIQRQEEAAEPPEEEPVQEMPIQRQAGEEEEPVQAQWAQRQDKTFRRNGRGQPNISPSIAATIYNPGSGNPMPVSVRQRIEPHIGANLSGVQVHTGPGANRAAGNLQARAFTHGPHIFLNSAESSSDVRLMAHEATHVVQQRAAPLVQRQPEISETPHEVQRLPFGIGDFVNDYVRHIPGYTLFTVIIGLNPLTGDRVERNAINLLQGFMGLVPFGTFIFDKLQEYGIIQAAFEWVEGELGRLNLSLDRIEQALEDAWEDVRIVEGFDYNLEVLRRHFGRLLSDVEAFALSLVDHIIELIKEAAIGVAEGLLADNKAWALIKKVLKRDPLRDEPVEASTTEIVEDFLLLIGKEQELEQMRQRGTLEETAAWLDTQLGTFSSLLGELGGLFAAAWDAIQPENLPDLSSNLQNLANQAAGFLQRVWDFATTVALQVLELIKKSLLTWLSDVAHETPGFHLITVILGRNPFTQEPVPRTAENIIKGFITLLPGGEQQYEELAQSGTIGQAAQRIEGAMAELGITWEFVVNLFTGIWDSLSIEDLIDPIGAFQRICDQFGEPISRLFAFVRVVVEEIFKLLLELMNFPTDILANIINNAMQAFEDIKRDPVGFLKNLLAAVKLGFSKFFDNFLRHLIDGVVDWLFAQLRKAGIEPPTDLSLESVLDLVLQILGISMDRIWEKLAQRIGQENVDRIRGAIDRLVGIWNFVRDVQERGVAAIWEYIESQISNLWDMVLEHVQNWIMERVVTRVTARLLSMLDPTGIMAVVNSFMVFFNAVQSAIEYLREMLEIVDSFVSTVAEIARGSIEGAAQYLENTLAQSLPVAIGFLANQVGLSNLGSKIAEILARIRAVVDRALDWLLDRSVSLGRRLLRALGMGDEEEAEEVAEDDPEKAMRIREGLAAIDQAEQAYLEGGKISREEAEQVAVSVRRNYPVFTTLRVVSGDITWDYEYEASPARRKTGEQKEEEEQNTYQASRNSRGNIVGDFAHFNWEGYNFSATPHPANVEYRNQNGTTVPRPQGGYEISGTTMGSIHTDDWRNTVIGPPKERRKRQLERIASQASGDEARAKELVLLEIGGTGDPRWESKSLLEAIEDGAKLSAEQQYGMSWPDLWLVGWSEHHIHPVNWGGPPRSSSNLQYLRDREHSPITGWWNSRSATLTRVVPPE